MMPHKCQAIVFICMDFRFHSDIRDFLVSLGLKDKYDLVSLAGATKGLADDDKASKELILKQIEVSKKLHRVSEVYLIHHMDCGAYGGCAAFKDQETEYRKQLADLEAAKEIINKKFNSLEVKRVLARIEDKQAGSEIDFEMVYGLSGNI